MCQWIESIALKDGIVYNLSYHQARLNRTLKDFDATYQISLETVLSGIDLPQSGYFKIRILYNAQALLSIEWAPYIPHLWKEFRLVEAGAIDYSYKYVDRSPFDVLKRGCSESEIIIIKDGSITDTSYSNLIFHKDGEWFTPTTFLLAGTQRSYLLDEQKIKEAEINIANLASFDSFKMINAMMPFDDAMIYDIKQIKPL